MESSNSRALLISGIAGLFAAYMVYVYVSQKEVAFKKKYGEEVQVLIAAKNIEEMGELTRDSIDVMMVPKLFVQPDAIKASEVKDLYENGISPVAAVPITKGEQLQLSKVLYDDPRDRLAKKVSVGKRAISVPVNDQYGVGRLVKPGDKVDLLSPVRFTDKDTDEVVIKTVLQNVLVLATGAQINNVVPRLVDQDPFSGRMRSQSLLGKNNYSTVTVEVEPHDAQKITYLATQGGTVYLTLRNPMDDDQIEKLSTTTSEEVLGSSYSLVRDKRYQLSAPPAPPPPPRAPASPPKPAPPRRRSL